VIDPGAKPGVLVVHPPLTVARDFIDYPYLADLGALSAAAALRGHARVTLVDAFALPGSTLVWREDGRAHMGASTDEVAAACRGTFDAIIVAFTPFHRPGTRDDVLATVLALLRGDHPSAVIVLADLYQSGQHYVATEAADVLRTYPEVDVRLEHEAEVAIVELVREVARGRRPSRHIRGTRPPSLDDVALPAWDAIDLGARDRFVARVVDGLGRGAWAFPLTHGRSLPWVSSRGCPYACLHCSSNPDRAPDEPKTQRRASAPRMHADLAALARLGARVVFVLDEMVNVHPRHLATLLDAAEAADVRLEFPNGMRADGLFDDDLVRLVGRITTLSISAESGSRRVLDDVVGKRLDRAAITRVAERCHRLGLPLMIHFMIGLPGERPSEINETLRWALELWDRFDARPAVQYATPLPGTALARATRLRVVDDRAAVDDWGPRFQAEPTPLPEAVEPERLRRFMQAFEARLAMSNGPRKLILNATYVCNNHCTFCAVGTRTQVDGHPPRQREILARYRKDGVELLDIDGGEPTMNPELVGLIRYARSIGYRRVNVTTNGRLCAYPEFAERLVRAGVTSILFSVHGADARTHAAQVGVAEAFEQTVAGIRNVVAAAPEGVELGMNVTLTKGNHRQLPQIAALALELGLPWLNIQFLTPFGRATAMVAPDTTEAAAIAMQVIDRFRDRMKLQVINLPYCFMPGYEAFMVGDRGKRERDMAFVNNERVNLAAYLAERRVRRPVCDDCVHACACDGFYELGEAPEPPWLVRPEDLVRPLSP
jgi:MoaA/NifB/PqqE/SkfB family radical SAM enzyme